MIIDFDSKNKGGGGKEPVVEALSVTENGIYNAPSGVDGFTPVDVNVPSREPVLESLSITDNGTYTPSAGKDGFDSVDVNVPKEHHNVTSKSITANGTYNSTGDEVWNEVSVNVPEKTLNKASVTKEYTSNGQYSIATPDGYDGISDVSVTVNVASSGGGTADYSDMQFKGGLTELDSAKYSSIQWTDLSYMFSYCENLTTLDLSGFNTSQVTDMSNMFYSCSSLTTLDLSGFNTSQVTDMSNMFNYCTSLNSLDVSHFDTSNVTDMAFMFYYCLSLNSLDVSHFDTSNVTTMYSMFSDCSSLTSLDVSHFDASNVTDMYNMFYRCMSLETIKCDGLQLPNIDLSSIGLDKSPLTVDSIVGLLNALPQSTNNYSFQIGQTNIDKLSDDQKAIATNKGWTLV